MIFVPRRNIYTRKPYWQRGSVSVTPFANAAQQGAVEEAGNVTVSGESISDIGVNRDARAAIVVRADGTIDKIVNTTVTQIDVATDWIDPNGDASPDYDTRYTGLTGDPLDGSTSLAEDVWGSIGADKFFEQRADAGSDDDFSSTITIQVRFQGGSPLDSASYTIAAQNVTI